MEPTAFAAYEAGMEAWLAAEAPGRALWMTLEMGSAQDLDHPASIVAHPSGGEGQRLELARCGYHPRELRISAEALASLRLALGTAAHVT